MPRTSSVFLGGVVVYSNEAKENLLGVPRQLLEDFGAVSRECATMLSRNVAQLMGSDIGVGITGIAGPDGGTDEKPVGTVFVSVSAGGRTWCKTIRPQRDRALNRNMATLTALDMVRRYLEGLK